MIAGQNHNRKYKQAPQAESARIRSVYAKRHNHFFYSFFEPEYLLSLQERERKTLNLLKSHAYSSLETLKILDVGCGTGGWLREFIRWGSNPENITGVDLIPDRIARARELCPSSLVLKCQNAAQLEMPDGSFDLVVQSTMFSSILDPRIREQVSREILRVLRPGGAILWYDFHINNPWNQNVRGIGKREIFNLFSGCEVSLQKLTLAPPIGRPVAHLSIALYRALASIKPFCTHYLGLIIKL